MSEWKNDAIPVRCWAVSHELPDTGETVVFDEGRSELLVLNQVGGVTWELLDGKRSVSQIAAELFASIESAPAAEVVLEEVVAFLRDMEQRGAVEEASGAA